jgi:hypothetical protein
MCGFSPLRGGWRGYPGSLPARRGPDRAAAVPRLNGDARRRADGQYACSDHFWLAAAEQSQMITGLPALVPP